MDGKGVDGAALGGLAGYEVGQDMVAGCSEAFLGCLSVAATGPPAHFCPFRARAMRSGRAESASVAIPKRDRAYVHESLQKSGNGVVPRQDRAYVHESMVCSDCSWVLPLRQEK